MCFAAAGAAFLDDGAWVAVAVDGGPTESGVGGDLVEGDRFSGENDCCAGVFDVFGCVVRVSSGLRVADVGVRSFDEAAVAFGFAGPAAGFGVSGQGVGVDALDDHHG
jgi:hypothetical protein